MFRSIAPVALGMAFSFLVLPSAFAQQVPSTATSGTTSWQMSTGFDYSLGKYGATSDTTVFDVPLDVQVQDAPFRVEATIPYLDLKGPGALAGSGVPIVVTPAARVRERSGIGDLNLTGGWTIHREDSTFPGLEIAGIVKVPTAESGLGTGKSDYTLEANIYHNLAPGYLLFGSAGYQWLGSPSHFRLENGVVATTGLNYKPTDNSALGVTAVYHQQYYRAVDDLLAVDPYYAWRVTRDWGFSVYGILGLTDGAPRSGGGLRLILYR